MITTRNISRDRENVELKICHELLHDQIKDNLTPTKTNGKIG